MTTPLKRVGLEITSVSELDSRSQHENFVKHIRPDCANRSRASSVRSHRHRDKTGGGFFVSAHHVLEDVEQPRLGAVDFADNSFKFFDLEIVESFAELDLVLFKSDCAPTNTHAQTGEPHAVKIPTRFELPNPMWPRWALMFEPVLSMGYPFSRDGQFRERGFQGHVVCRTKLDAHNSYELSFSAPLGMSGAPLFQNLKDKSEQLLIGVIIGNKVTSMEQIDEEEHAHDGELSVKITKRHFLSLAIATDIHELLKREVEGVSVEQLLVRGGIS